MQECEARIFIERALTDEKLKRRLGAALAKRCRKTLDERLLIMWQSLSNLQLGGTMFFGATAWRWTPCVAGHRWFLGSGYQKRSQELYELAGRVAKKLGRSFIGMEINPEYCEMARKRIVRLQKFECIK